MLTLNMMQAVEREIAGLGECKVEGRAVRYTEGRLTVQFWYPRPSVAQQALRVERNMARKG